MKALLFFLLSILLLSCDVHDKHVFSRLRDDIIINGEVIRSKKRCSVNPNTLREIYENYNTTEDMSTVFINSAHVKINIIIME